MAYRYSSEYIKLRATQKQAPHSSRKALECIGGQQSPKLSFHGQETECMHLRRSEEWVAGSLGVLSDVRMTVR